MEQQTIIDGQNLPATQVETNIVEELRQALSGLMLVEDITLLTNKAKPLVKFGGQLSTHEDTAVIFEEIIQRFAALGYTPTLSEEDEQHVIRALPQVADHKRGKPWVNALLFIATALSVLFLGALRELDGALPTRLRDLWLGWPFAFTLLGILSAHELSHYFVGRRYGSPVSLPYFIPMPLSILGTMGAVIVQKGPMHSRKALIDIGAAGPLGGLIVAIPLLIGGLMFTEVGHPAQFIELENGEGLMQEGNSLLYLGAKYIVHGRILPDPETGEDVWLSPPSTGGSVVFAAWAGLLVTALNLLPIGQLDGGHIAYALWGRRAWQVSRACVLVILGWGIFLAATGSEAGITWMIWGGLGMLMGPRHPPPLNDLTPLDRRRKVLGWAMVLIFLLIIIPIPLVEVAL